ncbi:alkaline phosphatase PhoX [Nocardiopsis sp. NPDC006832]|uniref:PhoX family protein n=1 Tax=Nocardiopsis sp. NPDC006832 TaxID=3157188 RepID=UPI0033CFC26E
MPPVHSRRRFLVATAAMSALTGSTLLGDLLRGGSPASADPLVGSSPTFTEVPVTLDDAVTVPPGHTARVLLPWGAPLRTDSPRWRPDAGNTAEEAARQVGTGHSGIGYLPLRPGQAGNRQGLLVVTHSQVDRVLLRTDGGRAGDAAPTAKEMASLGATIARVELVDGRWRVLGDELDHRLTGDSPTTPNGPLVGHPALDTGADPAGVLSGPGQATTPWGTCLTADAALDRELTPNEARRSGWAVEVDPFDPDSAPMKRTALGRMAHHGATVTESRGRAVVYLCDDSHLYKFVGAHPWRERLRDRALGPLAEGALYAARTGSDGSGTWSPLVHGGSGLGEGEGFTDQADVLLRAGEAAEAVDATRLRGPGTPAVHPATGAVYLSEADGQGGGRILSLSEGAADHGATLFSWHESTRTEAPPGGLHCGSDGRLWIHTDTTRITDPRAWERAGNSALLCADPDGGRARRFLTGPRGCAIAGVAATPDGRTLFVTVRGPGSATEHLGAPTVDDPRAVSNWPGFDPRGRPRSAVVVVRKDDGGVIGT